MNEKLFFCILGGLAVGYLIGEIVRRSEDFRIWWWSHKVARKALPGNFNRTQRQSFRRRYAMNLKSTLNMARNGAHR